MAAICAASPIGVSERNNL